MLDLALDVGRVLVGVLGLWLGASRFVAGASDLAGRAGIPPLIVGLTVVALGTSAPEFAVTVGAALDGKAAVSVANVVGSNVVNLGFVLGGAALFRALPTPLDIVRRDGPVLVAATLLATLLVADLRLSGREGLLLIGLLLAYLGFLGYRGVQGPDLGVEDPVPEGSPPREAARAVFGLVAVVVAAEFLVGGAVSLASAAGVSEWLIGETVVALGTSAPEIVASAAAIRQGRLDVSAGNVFGSCIVNLLGVLGVATLIRPLAVPGIAVESTLWLSGITLLAVGLTVTGRAMARIEGALLFAVGVGEWLVVLLFG